jgi:hypothetical protein
LKQEQAFALWLSEQSLQIMYKFTQVRETKFVASKSAESPPVTGQRGRARKKLQQALCR